MPPHCHRMACPPALPITDLRGPPRGNVFRLMHATQHLVTFWQKSRGAGPYACRATIVTDDRSVQSFLKTEIPVCAAAMKMRRLHDGLAPAADAGHPGGRRRGFSCPMSGVTTHIRGYARIQQQSVRIQPNAHARGSILTRLPSGRHCLWSLYIASSVASVVPLRRSVDPERRSDQPPASQTIAGLPAQLGNERLIHLSDGTCVDCPPQLVRFFVHLRQPAALRAVSTPAPLMPAGPRSSKYGYSAHICQLSLYRTGLSA